VLIGIGKISGGSRKHPIGNIGENISKISTNIGQSRYFQNKAIFCQYFQNITNIADIINNF